MKIIVMNDYANINGGASQIAIASLNLLSDRGHEVVFIAGSGLLDPCIDTSKIKVINFELYDLVTNPSKVNAFLSGLWNFKTMLLLNSILSKSNRENTIIHIHGWTKVLSSSIFKPLINRNFKVVVTLHDYFSICPNGGLFNYKTNSHCSLKPMSFSCLLSNCDKRSYYQKLWRYLRQYIQNKISGMPSKLFNFVTVSAYSEALLKPLLPKRSPIRRISNPTNIFKARYTNPESNIYYTFVGRLEKEKGPDLFAKALSLLKVKGLFVGDGSLAQELSLLNPGVLITGWKNQAEVLSYIRLSKALIFPSVCHETQGLVISEAAALGIPSVVADNCAGANLVVNNKTGLLFKGGDEVDLADKILLLESTPGLINRLGKNAYYNYWKNPSNLESYVDKLESYYADILHSN